MESLNPKQPRDQFRKKAELKLIIDALCYAVCIATDDKHKKHLAQLVYAVSNGKEIASPLELEIETYKK